MLNSGHIRIYHISRNTLKDVENDGTSVCNVPDIRKGVAVFEGSQVSPAYKSSMKLKVSMEYWWNDINRGKPKCSEKNLSHSTCSATNLQWTDTESNVGLRPEKSACNSSEFYIKI
jgi:hypothetical protein